MSQQAKKTDAVRAYGRQKPTPPAPTEEGAADILCEHYPCQAILLWCLRKLGKARISYRELGTMAKISHSHLRTEAVRLQGLRYLEITPRTEGGPARVANVYRLTAGGERVADMMKGRMVTVSGARLRMVDVDGEVDVSSQVVKEVKP